MFLNNFYFSKNSVAEIVDLDLLVSDNYLGNSTPFDNEQEKFGYLHSDAENASDEVTVSIF